MDYQTFVNELQQQLRAHLPEGLLLSHSELVKNNLTPQDGLALQQPGSRMAPVLNMHEMYTRFIQGESMDHLISWISTWYDNTYHVMPQCADNLVHWEWMRTKVVPRLISRKRNQELLSQVPHSHFLNLAVVYYCLVTVNDSPASVLIKQEHMRDWTIDTAQLDVTARKNMHSLTPLCFMTMKELMTEFSCPDLIMEDAEDLMYVLTNQDKYFGAIWMSDPEVLSAIGKGLDSDFYILPSSVHEVLIVPFSAYTHATALKDMVVDINEQFVDERDILEDTVYRYENRTGRLWVEA